MFVWPTQSQLAVGRAKGKRAKKGRRRRHRPKEKNEFPKHNSPCSKYTACRQYLRTINLPDSEREPGDVKRIAENLRVPVTTKTLRTWHKDIDKGVKLKRKKGSGTQVAIMDRDPIYRNVLHIFLTRQVGHTHISRFA